MERAEIGVAVAGKRLDVHVAQADGCCPTRDLLDRVVEARRRRDTMQLREARDVIFGGHPGQLVIERPEHGTIDEHLRRKFRRRLRGKRGSRHREEHAEGDAVVHGSVVRGSSRTLSCREYTHRVRFGDEAR